MTTQHDHRLLGGALRVRAAEYVKSLYVGATVDANDREYLAETQWGKYLDDALAERGLCIDGDTVVPLLRMAAAE